MKIHTREDQRYKERRTVLGEQIGPVNVWEIADHWPLYSGIGNLARQLAIIDLFRQSLVVPGDIAEFGVWRGANTSLFAKLLRILDPHGAKVVHAFDSFQGLSAFDAADGAAGGLKGSYKGSLERMKAFIDLYGLDDIIEIHQGLIEDTLPVLLQQRAELSFSLVYCDTDLHQSTTVILEQLHGRLSKGGLIVFDEWNHPKFPGEGVAANEFLQRFGSHYEVAAVRNTRQPSLLLRKVSY